MSSITEQEAIQLGVKIGVETALEEIRRHNEETAKNKYDRRLRNTDLLLKNYTNFVEHCENAVYTKQQLDDFNIIDLMDELEDYGEDIYIETISKSKVRTAIIIKHIETIFNFYEFQANKSNDEALKRRQKVIEAIYVDKKKQHDVAEELYISTKTVKRDKALAIKEISSLMFGVDGMRMLV